MTNQVIHGDCMEVLAEMEDNSIDTIITDPPYGLKFMSKNWDHGIPGIPFWSEMLRVAKPGATLLAFGGTRTHHRLMVAIEDAGWEIRDCLMWLYGSGFPKSHNISKGIDRAAGKEREVIGTKEGAFLKKSNAFADKAINGTNYNVPITAPATEAAKIFDGYGTGLKPAYEPIILAMKPIEQTYANNAQVWGVAGLNIDGSRISTQDDASPLTNNQEPSILDDACACIRSFLRDFYDQILSTFHCDSTSGISPKHNVDGLNDKWLEVFLCDTCANHHSPNGKECEQSSSLALGSQSDCLVCRHFCDGLSRLLLMDDLSIQTLQGDVLKCIHPSLNWGDLDEVSYDSLYCLCISRLPNCHSVSSVLTQLYSLLKSLSNYTILSEIPQYIPNGKNKVYGKGKGGGVWNKSSQGRWPSNVLLSHSENCVRRGERKVKGSHLDHICSNNSQQLEGLGTQHRTGYTDPNGLETVADWICVEDCAVRLLDEQSGESKSRPHKNKTIGNSGVFNKSNDEAFSPYDDSGSASRFFYTSKAPNREKWFYCQLCQAAYPNKERDNHAHDIDQGQRKHIIAHPTVKPLEIAKYLATLTKTPTGGVVLDPFAGSGTTALACIETGRDFILIEKESDYYEIAKARVESAMNEPRQAELF